MAGAQQRQSQRDEPQLLATLAPRRRAKVGRLGHDQCGHYFFGRQDKVRQAGKLELACTLFPHGHDACNL